MSRSELLRQCLEYGSIRPALNESSIFLQGDWEGHATCDAVKSELERIFRRYTGLVSIKVLPSPNKRYPPHTASSRGFVNFETAQQASRAVAAQRSCTTVLGKEVKMMISAKDINIKDAPDVRAMLTVVIRHCPASLKLKDIEAKVQREYGEILRANMRPPRYAGQDSEVIIQFVDKSSADNAMRLSQTKRFQVHNAILTLEKYATQEGELSGLRPGQVASYDGGASQAASRTTSQAGGVQHVTDALEDTHLHDVADDPMPEPFPEPLPEPIPEPYLETDPQMLLFGGPASHGRQTPGHMSAGSQGDANYMGHASLGGEALGYDDSSATAAPRARAGNGPLHAVDNFHCPITHELFQVPASAPDGRVYEREAIEQWVAAHGCSPFTSQPMDPSELRPVPGFAEALQMLQWYNDDRETMVQRLSMIKSLVNSPLQQGSNGAVDSGAA